MAFLRDEYGVIRYDYILIGIILLLILLGFVVLFSASFLQAGNDSRFQNDGFGPMMGNFSALFVFLGLLILFVLMKFFFFRDKSINSRFFVYSILWGTIFINIIPIVLFRLDLSKDLRWFSVIGIRFQPSEFIKIALPLYLAYKFNQNKENVNAFCKCLIPVFLFTGILFSLVLAQKNLSDAVLIALFSFFICLASGIRVGWFALALAIIIPIGFAFINSDETWNKRWNNHWKPLSTLNDKDEGYQIIHSIRALEAGGFSGVGIGHGERKINVPEVHGDFVFSSYAEETGFLGVLLYLALTGSFAGICYIVAWQSKDRFIQLFVFGLITPIVLQILINISVVARILPVTGIPLPFFSSGGTSMLVMLIISTFLVYFTRKTIKSGDMRGLKYDG